LGQQLFFKLIIIEGEKKDNTSEDYFFRALTILYRGNAKSPPAGFPAGDVACPKKPRRVCRPQAANEMQSIFGRGVYLDKNSSQSASVELVRHGEPIMRAADCRFFVQKGHCPFGTILE
jgi:hypothetical protein